MSNDITRADDGSADAEAFPSAAAGITRDPGSSVPPRAATVGSGATGDFAAGTSAAAAQPVAFCQDCGRALTSETLRPVGRAVFCEPCLERRMAGPSAAGGYSGAAGVPGGPFPGVSAAESQPVAYSSVSGSPIGSLPAAPGEPRPVLAAILGLIPGVGAMYNGQFAKGIVHLVIFAVLLSLSDNVNGIFSLFVAGWVFYQSFEAYHTAVARRDFLPLPNAFGFNDIGERLGFGVNRGAASGTAGGPVPPVSGRSWSPNTGIPSTWSPNTRSPNTWNPNAWNPNAWNPAAATPPAPAESATVQPAANAASAGWPSAGSNQPAAGSTQPAGPASSAPGWPQASASPAQPASGGFAGAPQTPGASWGGYAVPPAAARDWVGYVSPTAFPQAGVRSQAGAAAGYVQPPYTAPAAEPPHAPYAETFVGGTPPSTGAGLLSAAPSAIPRFPSGALWLIGLGLLILLGNILPDWRMSERWMPPVLFAGLSVWLLTRRLHTGARLACIIRWPALLMVLAILFTLHAMYFVVTFGTMCAVLLIALGALLLIERTLGASGPPPPQAPGPFATRGADPAATSSFVPSAGPVQTSFTTAGPAVGSPIVADDVPEGR